MRRRVEPDILEAAIELFGLYSFNGVTTRDLAKRADVVEGAIYQWFDNKENLYLQAVSAVITQTNQQFTQFVMKVFGSSEDLDPARIAEAVRAWYDAIPRPAARLLLQVLISDDKRNKLAREPLDQIINAVAKTLDRQKKANKKLNPQAAAKTLVRSLFWGKVIEGKAAEPEVNQILQQWLLGIAPSS
jgi:AcrR family transcriptional regulator